MFLEDKAHGEPAPSLKGFIAWLETKDPNERYNWANPKYCACAQYYNMGLAWCLDRDGNELNLIAKGKSPYDWTFGACLTRARAALASQCTA